LQVLKPKYELKLEKHYVNISKILANFFEINGDIGEKNKILDISI
jgi:hypothetical protein